VKDISELKGKVLGVMTKGASSDHAATALLRQSGLKAGQDVKFLYLGGVKEVVAALDKGRSLVRQNPELVKNFLKAYVEAIKVTHEEPEIAKKALARFLATEDKSIIDEAYQAFRPLFPKVPYLNDDIVRSVLAVTDHPKAATADPKEFYNNRFLKELEDSGFIREIYARK
jgi:ABC-type nitrate/sulfonate/bicarbonate transport system substrate-binding protein